MRINMDYDISELFDEIFVPGLIGFMSLAMWFVVGIIFRPGALSITLIKVIRFLILVVGIGFLVKTIAKSVIIYRRNSRGRGVNMVAEVDEYGYISYSRTSVEHRRQSTTRVSNYGGTTERNRHTGISNIGSASDILAAISGVNVLRNQDRTSSEQPNMPIVAAPAVPPAPPSFPEKESPTCDETSKIANVPISSQYEEQCKNASKRGLPMPPPPLTLDDIARIGEHNIHVAETLADKARKKAIREQEMHAKLEVLIRNRQQEERERREAELLAEQEKRKLDRELYHQWLRSLPPVPPIPEVA